MFTASTGTKNGQANSETFRPNRIFEQSFMFSLRWSNSLLSFSWTNYFKFRVLLFSLWDLDFSEPLLWPCFSCLTFALLEACWLLSLWIDSVLWMLWALISSSTFFLEAAFFSLLTRLSTSKMWRNGKCSEMKWNCYWFISQWNTLPAANYSGSLKAFDSSSIGLG